MKDVIAGRQVCAEWYSGQNLQLSSSLGIQDESHRHFIDVLREVRDILEEAREKHHAITESTTSSGDGNAPASTKKPKGYKAPESEAKDRAAMANLFAHLEIEEPSASPLGKKSKVGKAKPVQPAAPSEEHDYTITETDDTAFALWCFLEDLRDARTFARDTWKEFANGDVSFLVAAMVTDVAFGLMCSADNDFTFAYPKLKSHGDINRFFGLAFAVTDGRCSLVRCNAAASVTQTKPGIDIADVMCPIAGVLLQAYEAKFSVRGYTVGTVRGLHDGQPVASSSMQNLISTWHEFGPVLLEHEPSFGEQDINKLGMMMHCDEFSRGLHNLTETGAMPMWLAVACQTYMDVYDIVGSNPACGVEILRNSLLRTETAVRHLMSAVPKTNMDDKFEEMATICGRSAHGFASAGLRAQDVREYVARHGGANNALAAPDPLLSSMPVYTGTLLHGVKVLPHIMSIAASNIGCDVLAMAYLYKALRHLGLSSAVWHDLDFIIAEQSMDRPLVTKTPVGADPRALARHFQLALGVPVTHFTRNPTLALPKNFEPKNARRLKMTSRYGRASVARTNSDKVRGVQESNNYEAVLQALTESDDEAVKPTTGAKFTPLQLLSTYRKSVISDEPHLNFDYIGFWVDCEQLLHGMSPKLLAKLPRSLSQNVGAAWQFVDALLRDAANVQSQSRSLSNAAISDAATILDEFIKHNAKKYTQPAFDQSSGRIPKALRPTFVPRLPRRAFYPDLKV